MQDLPPPGLVYDVLQGGMIQVLLCHLVVLAVACGCGTGTSFAVVSFFNWSSRRSKSQELKLWLSRKGMNRLLRIWATVGSVVVVMATVVGSSSGSISTGISSIRSSSSQS